jgi:transposase InsO family protein
MTLRYARGWNCFQVGPHRPRRLPPSTITDDERAAVLAVLNSESYRDLAIPQVWARELDEGRFWCSQSRMYRIARAAGRSRERRAQATHPPRVRPELVAHGPNQVCSWDITAHVVGWLVAHAEDAVVATDFLADAVARNGVIPNTIHADRGGSMTSKPVSELMIDLGVCRSHSRPQCSNDNPYSEAQFKTLKYMPDFPDRFGSLADARAFCERFFTAYNHEHRHSGIGMRAPASVHFDTATEIRAHRQATLDRAHAQHPERFTHRPHPPRLPELSVDLTTTGQPRSNCAE